MIHLTELIERYNDNLGPGEPVLTQRRLADGIGTSEALVSKHISGEHQMLFETAARYARFFGIRPAEVDDRFSDGEVLAAVPTGECSGLEDAT